MTLREGARVVLARKWIVVFAVLVAALGSFAAASLQTPVYEATAEMLIEPRGSGGLFEAGVTNLNDRNIQTEIRVIEGQAVRQRVVDDLGLGTVRPVSPTATGIGQTDVIAIRLRSTDAENAPILANAYANAYISLRRKQSVDELLAASTEVQGAINDLQAEVNRLDEDDPRRESLVAQAANFSTTLDQLRVDAALRTGGASIVRSAEVPAQPVEPDPLRSAILAGLLGLLLGLGIAFLIDYLDDKIRNADELEKVTGHATLASVPVDSPREHLPVSVSYPDSEAVEEYRGLRTNLQFLGLDQALSTIQVTSSLPGEGKTTTAANLAVVLARAGKRVALVDADLRRPRVHQMFDLAVAPGLTDLLLGVAPKTVAHIVDLGLDDRLTVFTAGESPSNPSEMLGGARMRAMLVKMGEHYDYVVIDSAPILPVTDSVALTGSIDGVIVVAQAGRVTKAGIGECLERLDLVRANILGYVLNQVKTDRRDEYIYGGYNASPGTRMPGRVMLDVSDDAGDSFADV